MKNVRTLLFFFVPFFLGLSLSSDARGAVYEGGRLLGRTLRQILDIEHVLPGVFG